MSKNYRPGFPHRRGGGPITFNRLGSGANVFPTGVGVDRGSRLLPHPCCRFPHRRGGGPPSTPPVPLQTFVFPTGVGVDRCSSAAGRASIRFPHRRGGGPFMAAEFYESNSFPHRRGGGPPHSPSRARGHSFSPQAWGWTDRLLAIRGVSVLYQQNGSDFRSYCNEVGCHLQCCTHTDGSHGQAVARGQSRTCRGI